MARFIGDYEVLSELGVGHFGTVYLAAGETPARGRVPAKRRLVAIKKLRDSADARSVDLLLQEFALLDQVKHRGIVRVYEYLEHDHAVVMEHIHGVSLRQVLQELSRAREQVFTEAAIEIGCELADALYQAYTTPGDNGEPLQLVHRDLKPANVMLTPQGEVKILDFGLARVDNADFAKDDKDRIKGTPIYMAPEQARGEAVDHRTDLFALGLILFELLDGEAAYRVPANSRDPLAEVYAAIEAGDLKRQCADLESRLPALGPVVSRLLQRRPEDRYQTGHDLLVDLRRQLYRDRGSYLSEFCEFFFGAINPLPDAPTLDQAKGSRTGRGRRMSIEERLRQSMNNESAAQRGSGRPSPAPRRPRPPAPTPVSTAAPPPPPDPGAGMSSSNRNGGSGRRPVRPPVGGSASRAESFTPGQSGPRTGGKQLKTVGERSPDETGMLEMVPLSANQDEADAAADPSATAFFAIPAPKADRGRPAGTGGGLPPGPMPGGGGFGGPPSPPGGGGFGAAPPPPPGGGGFGVPPTPPGAAGFGAPPSPPGPAGVGAPMAPAQPQIRGPVAGYGGQQAGQAAAPGAATPFQVAGPTPQGVPGADANQRVQSTRLYAILFALFMLIGVAVVVAVWFQRDTGEPEPAPATTTTVVADDSIKVKKKEDTGIAPPPPPDPKPKTTRKSSSSKPKTTTAPAPPPTSPGSIKVTLTDASAFTSVTVLCPSGFRAKGTFAGGSTTLNGVPAGESCTLSFAGGLQPGRFSGAKAGQALTCSMVGTGMICK